MSRYNNPFGSNRNANRIGSSAHTMVSGQSLIEFVLVLIFLMILLTGGVSFGIGTYRAQQASDAIVLPATHKLDMAKMPSAVSNGVLLGYTNAEAGGALLDNIQVSSVSADIALIQGTKTVAPLVSFIPGFNIHTAQIINRALLEPTSTGNAKASPMITPPLPGGTPNQVPIVMGRANSPP